MATSFRVTASSLARQSSLESGDPLRVRSHSRVCDAETTPNSNPPSEHVTDDVFFSNRSLLAYASPSPSLTEFPMPPKTLHILPHPHAPPTPSSGGLLPAIYRDPGSQCQYVSALANTLAETAVIGQQEVKGNTIHGRTSFDLLSATGPVPIHFALGRPINPTAPSPTVDSTREQHPSDLLSGTNSQVDPSPSRSRTEGSDTDGNRRSFSDIISAIETPSSFPIGRPPAGPSLHPLSNTPNSPLGGDGVLAPVAAAEGGSAAPRAPLPSNSADATPQYSQRTPAPSAEMPKRAPRKLSKSSPSSNNRPHPFPTSVPNLQNSIAMPKIPIATPSSLPSSPRTVAPPNGRLQGAKSIPDLRDGPKMESPHQVNLCNSGSRSPRRGSSSSASTNDKVASCDADILGCHSLELSPNWDSARYPGDLDPDAHSPASTARPALQMPNSTAPISSGSSLSPPEQVYPYSQQRITSGASVATTAPVTTAMASPPSPPPRALSLRRKVSISTMRNARRRHDSAAADKKQAVPRLHDERSSKEVTVEVDDMEFTLVKPDIFRNGSPISLARDSEDGAASSSSSRETASHAQGRGEHVLPRSRTPSASQGQTLYVRGPGPVSPSPDSPSSVPQTPLLSPFSATFSPSMDSHASHSSSEISRMGSRGRLIDSTSASDNAENHRQLEVKWINAMSSVPSAEAGKSRKIRRLVIDGIPTSVRGVVWLYLTDSKGRRMPGVYDQLRRRKARISDAIWTDVKSLFSNQPHLCHPEGSVMSILQAYLSMVPDTAYNYGLTLIAGNLLLQTHEEDSFWTFVALMDRHLRGYFSPTAKLLEIDSILFERAVGAFDKALATRLFDTLRVSAISFCGHWFTTLFTCALPPSFVPRIWDAIMYFADPTFLFRLGLAVLKLCRPFIMDEVRCAEDAIPFLIKPPASAFITNPDGIISSALRVKCKEDDLRKVRPKIEAQLKQRHPLRPTPLMR